jgi:hypothetical protein
MKWIKYSDRPPKTDCLALVCNESRPFNPCMAIYSAAYQEWMHSEYSKVLTFPLAVTHYILIPDLPRQ